MLVDKEIKNYGDILITPFSENHVGCVSYDLDYYGFVDLTGDVVNDNLFLTPGSSKMIKCAQHLHMPHDLVGTIGNKHSRTRQGLIAVEQKFFPGHDTDICIRVMCIGDAPILVKPGQPIAQIYFDRLTQVPEKTYDQHHEASFNHEKEYSGLGKYAEVYRK